MEKRHHLKKINWHKMNVDPILFSLLIILTLFGLLILYSACNQKSSVLINQVGHFILAFSCLLMVAQIPPNTLKIITPWLYGVALFLLLLVPVLGHSSQGAKRWLGLSSFHIQPSEIMKIAVPMMLAWIIEEKSSLPQLKTLFICLIVLIIPSLLIIKQPDLGTAILIISAGITAIILSGIRWRYLLSLLSIFILSLPLVWHFLHTYQKQRILNLLNPARDPLGSGYNIIQSKIAVGSGGFSGKGWLHGTQSHLAFLPTHTTDFIFAVNAEEFGFIGSLILLSLLLLIFIRCLFITFNSQSVFTRILAGALSSTFIISALINIGMVIGILPVVGIPLPLVSYGGSYLITNFIAFGILTSLHSHKKLWGS
jgi:rod shape determining protein RodA